VKGGSGGGLFAPQETRLQHRWKQETTSYHGLRRWVVVSGKPSPHFEMLCQGVRPKLYTHLNVDDHTIHRAQIGSEPFPNQRISIGRSSGDTSRRQTAGGDSQGGVSYSFRRQPTPIDQVSLSLRTPEKAHCLVPILDQTCQFHCLHEATRPMDEWTERHLWLTAIRCNIPHCKTGK
jgi:hypothetical protein